MDKQHEGNSIGRKREYWLAFSLLLNLAVVGLVELAIRWPHPGTLHLETAVPTGNGEVRIAVYVSGAVRNPGVYWLSAGALAQEALAAAGGPLANTDLENINLAQRLSDGEHLRVPSLDGDKSVDVTVAGTSAGQLDINTATEAELDNLPGIGPSLAKQIVIYRQEHGAFSSVDELQNVKGIGEAKLAEIRGLVTVR